ncbi:sensor histidine kinase [Candidatus Solirubrobacter pratensis]|uniref:sensor histidine kinase n=1 Tax=Candidatus Solirubrobacter pratensis TaxID=1298857 RepID=UPI00040916E0|nr:GAF domain-containing sensor histidine kinase [Candidatus Solirubrobacter pratensis]
MSVPADVAANGVEEQAALRRVATMVAREVSQERLLAVVNEEIGRLVGADAVVTLRFDVGDRATVVAEWSATGLELPLGARRPLDPLLRAVREGARPVSLGVEQRGSYQAFAEEAQRLRVHSSVGVPIEVAGRVWGVVFAVSSGSRRLAPHVAERIEGFTAMVSAGIATAQARAELTLLAQEQAALRRVAELVARGADADGVFAAVAEELWRLVGGTALMHRYDGELSTCVAAWRESGATEFVGVSEVAPEGSLLSLIRSTLRPALIDDYPLVPGPFGELARRLGIRSAAGGPIMVQGRPWGQLAVVFSQPEPPPAGTELRVARFAALVSTAIANAQARSELQRLADEQGALRRVATLVAHGASQPHVFEAVALEASRLHGDQPTALLRYEPEGYAVILALRGTIGWVGRRIPVVAPSLSERVMRTRAPARLDDYRDVPGAREAGLGAAVGAPIEVGGRLWGLLAVMTGGEPLPPRTEERLAQFSELVATAIGNAVSRATLTASRARIVATADETRRRIQRDLHDGAQQGLVNTVITLKLARGALPDGGTASELMDESLRHAEGAIDSLRDLVHGIMPSTLANGGLRAALRSLADRLAIDVEVDVPDARLPAALETTAYFVVAEALTNVVKHSGATGARVGVRIDGGRVHLEVHDDGAGGADPASGSGLVGLVDRVEASGGTIAVTSPPGVGTMIVVDLPVTRAG